MIEPITVYHLGEEWWDLCAGAHVENTSELHPKAIELESLAGAYWRGDETKAQLQRIYGTAWETPEQLAAYKHRKEEALRRDHRKLGKELGLFIFADAVGGFAVVDTKRHCFEKYFRRLLETRTNKARAICQ